MAIRARVDTRPLNRALDRVSGAARGSASVRALNRALSAMRKDASTQVRKRYTVKAGAVKRRALREQKARRNRRRIALYANARPIPLIDFSVRDLSRTGRGVSVGVKKSGGRTRLGSAFVATMASGKRGVFERVARGSTRVGRLPIRELFGPSVAGALQTRQSRERLARIGRERFAAEYARSLAQAIRRREARRLG